MSTPPLAKKECSKQKYSSNLNAKLALMKIQKKDSSKRVSSETRTYYCSTCKGWHLAGVKNWRKNKVTNQSAKKLRVSDSELDERLSLLLQKDPKMPIVAIMNKIRGVKKTAVKASLKRIHRANL